MADLKCSLVGLYDSLLALGRMKGRGGAVGGGLDGGVMGGVGSVHSGGGCGDGRVVDAVVDWLGGVVVVVDGGVVGIVDVGVAVVAAAGGVVGIVVVGFEVFVVVVVAYVESAGFCCPRKFACHVEFSSDHRHLLASTVASYPSSCAQTRVVGWRAVALCAGQTPSPPHPRTHAHTLPTTFSSE